MLPYNRVRHFRKPGMNRFLAVAVAIGTLVTSAFAQLTPPTPHPVLEHIQQGNDAVHITTLSARNDMVTGGDVLVRITVEDQDLRNRLRVSVNGRDETPTFHPSDAGGLFGLVNGLQDGPNWIEVTAPTAIQARLEITNFPITGPVFSGPHEKPFICQTHHFIDPPGNLGLPQDADCSIPTRIDYFYVTRDNEFKPLTDRGSLPDDIADMVEADGAKVPFIVRLETGTINRAIYQIAIPHDPAGLQLNFTTASPSWNGRLLYTFGGGCQGGWYVQGLNTGGVLDIPVLARGYAIASSSLNVFGNNCKGHHGMGWVGRIVPTAPDGR